VVSRAQAKSRVDAETLANLLADAWKGKAPTRLLQNR
jgi:hypothetical protein